MQKQREEHSHEAFACFLLTSLSKLLIPIRRGLWKPWEGERAPPLLVCVQPTGLKIEYVLYVLALSWRPSVYLQERRFTVLWSGEHKTRPPPLHSVSVEKPTKQEVVKLPWRAQQHRRSAWHREGWKVAPVFPDPRFSCEYILKYIHRSVSLYLSVSKATEITAFFVITGTDFSKMRCSETHWKRRVISLMWGKVFSL